MRARVRSSVVATIAGVLLLSYPLVNVPNQPALAFGIPLLYLYLFTLWLVGIGVAWALSRGE